jgi:4-amino-4-deoxy-L-arabinose transferase-like glycosyltransferase
LGIQLESAARDKPFLTRRRFWLELVMVLALTAVALGVRLYRLREIPPGLYIDEAANGVDVLGILDGQHPIFFERNNGREPLFIYLQALIAALLGATPFALRLASALVGAATIPAVYWMVREAFAGDLESGRFMFHGLDVRAVWTALFLAFSYWHLSLSRVGLRVIMLPLLAAITFAWFWRAWWRLKADGPIPWVDGILCGVSLGASLYTYTSARFLPVVLILTTLSGVLTDRRPHVLSRRRVLVLALILAVGLVAALPLGIYFASHPGSFIGRAGQVSILTDHPGDQSVVVALVKNTLKTAGVFGVIADSNLLSNPAGRPAFDLLLSAWLLAGVVLALVRRRSLPYLFALIWFVVMAMPALLSDWAPHTLRMLAVAPAACLLAVLAMVEAGRRLGEALRGRWGGQRQWIVVWLPLPFLLFSGITGVKDYFVAGRGEDIKSAFDTRFVDAASLVGQHKGDDGVWVVPVWPVFYLPEPGYIFDFLLRRPVPLGVVKVSESSAPLELTRLTNGKTYAHLLQWSNAALEADGGYVLRDAKNLVAFLLRKHGKATGETGRDLISYTTYEVPVSAEYRVATDVTPADISFGGKVKLTGFAYGRTAANREETAAALDEHRLPSGHEAWAVLHWQAQTALSNGPADPARPAASDGTGPHLKTTLYLVDEDGHLAGQVDDVLASDRYLLLDTWEEGEKASTYAILPTDAGIPPGKYRLYVAVYDPSTMQRLPVLDVRGAPGETAALLGDLEVTRPLEAPEVAPANPLPEGTSLGSGLTLLGYDLPSRSLSPGERLALLLYWRADRKPNGDYQVGVELRHARGQTAAGQETRPANGRYPTTEWSAGDVVRDWHELSLSPDMSPGSYDLVVTLRDGTAVLGQADLGTVEVSGRPHLFTPPAVEYLQEGRLADSIAFLGFDLSSDEIQAGTPISLTLYWQPVAPVDKPYTVFVHLLGPDGQVWAQQDNPPGKGALPTSGWLPGEYVADSYQLVVTPETPAGEYRLEVGMYDPATGERLPTANAAGLPLGDRILLGQPIQVTGR